MATPVFTCGAECGIINTNGHLVDGLLGAAPTISTTTVRTGSRSLQCAVNGVGVNGAEIELVNLVTASTRIFVARFYFRLSAFVSGENLWMFYATNGANTVGVGQEPVALDFATFSDNGTTTTWNATDFNMSTGVWYRCDVKIDMSANPWTVDAKITESNDTVTTLGQSTRAVAAATPTTLSLGARVVDGSATAAANFFYDDILISQTSGDYPLGGGEVLAYSPTGDGTHTATDPGTSNFTSGTTAAPTTTEISGAETTLYQFVDAVPLLNDSNLLNQRSNAATEYIEVTFNDAPAGRTPRIVAAIGARREAAATAGVSDHRLRDTNGGTENAIISGSRTGATTDTVFQKAYNAIPGGSAWTETAFNALRWRFGYSSDANPDQYWRGAMLEAEYLVQNVAVAGTEGTATADVPTVVWGLAALLAAVQAAATGDGQVVVIAISEFIVGVVADASGTIEQITVAPITPGASTATGDGLAAIIAIHELIAAVAATADAEGLIPVIFVESSGNALIVGVASTATGEVLLATICPITPGAVTADATVPLSVVSISEFIEGVVATASGDALNINLVITALIAAIQATAGANAELIAEFVHNAFLYMDVATATANARRNNIYITRTIAVLAAVAQATGAVEIAVVFTGDGTAILAVAATATGAASLPTIFSTKNTLIDSALALAEAGVAVTFQVADRTIALLPPNAAANGYAPIPLVNPVDDSMMISELFRMERTYITPHLDFGKKEVRKPVI